MGRTAAAARMAGARDGVAVEDIGAAVGAGAAVVAVAPQCIADCQDSHWEEGDDMGYSTPWGAALEAQEDQCADRRVLAGAGHSHSPAGGLAERAGSCRPSGKTLSQRGQTSSSAAARSLSGSGRPWRDWHQICLQRPRPLLPWAAHSAHARTPSPAAGCYTPPCALVNPRYLLVLLAHPQRRVVPKTFCAAFGV